MERNSGPSEYLLGNPKMDTAEHRLRLGMSLRLHFSKESSMSHSSQSAADQQVAARDTTFDGIVPERVWLSFHNTKRKGYLTVTLEVNGIEKVINELYIPGLDLDEGICCESQNLTWLVNHGR